jgi:hypothetical protein
MFSIMLVLSIHSSVYAGMSGRSTVQSSMIVNELQSTDACKKAGTSLAKIMRNRSTSEFSYRCLEIDKITGNIKTLYESEMPIPVSQLK